LLSSDVLLTLLSDVEHSSAALLLVDVAPLDADDFFFRNVPPDKPDSLSDQTNLCHCLHVSNATELISYISSSKCNLASPVSQLPETGVQKGRFWRLSGYGD